MIMKFIWVLILSSVFLSGCGTLSFLNPRRSSPKTVYTQSSNYEYGYYKDKKQGIVIKTIKKSKDKTIPKQTIGQRIGNWFTKAATLSVILLVVGLFLAPTVTIGILFTLWKRARRAFIETVKAIKAANVVRENEVLHNALAVGQSRTTKKMVSDVKSKL